MHPARLVDTVRRAMPADGVVSLDNGMYKLWFARQYRARQPYTLLLDYALASMGAGLPAAIATAFLLPGRKVLAVCGDGGFMMNSQEMETAVRLRLDLTVLLLRDDAWGMIRWKQEEMGLPEYGMGFGNPDFVRYAQAYGARGHRADSTASLARLLQDCLARPGIDLIEAAIDYSDDHRIFNVEIPALSAAALSHTGIFMLAQQYPFYLANQPEQPNTALEVTDKFTGKVATRWRWPMPPISTAP